MAIIGLLDWDLIRWRQPTVFNLELMKLATYHKSILRDIVEMELKFSSDMCTKVYIQKDYEDYSYPSYITEDPKVTWRGLALSNGSYSPMDLAIERCVADTSIYEKLSRYYQRTTDKKRIFNTMMKAQHLRLSLDGKNIFDGWERQLFDGDGRTRHFIIHDKNIVNIKDAYDMIKYIRERYGWRNTSFGFKFPIIINSEEELLKWGNIPKINNISNIYVTNLLSNEVLNEICLTKQKITYLISNDNWTHEKLLQSLSEILLQGIFLSKYSIILSLKIDNNFLLPPLLKETIRMLNDYFETIIYYKNQLVFCGFTYCKYCYNKLQEETKIEMFKYLKENAEDFFNLLYGAEYVTLEKGILIPHMYTEKEIEIGGGYGGYYYKQNKKMHPTAEQLNYAKYVLPESLYLE